MHRLLFIINNTKFNYKINCQHMSPCSIIRICAICDCVRRGCSHTWWYVYWGCAAGQGAFFNFQLRDRVAFFVILSFQNLHKVLFCGCGFDSHTRFRGVAGTYQRGFQIRAVPLRPARPEGAAIYGGMGACPPPPPGNFEIL